MRVVFLLLMLTFLLQNLPCSKGQEEDFICDNICQDGYEVTRWGGRVSLAWWTTLSCVEWDALARQGEFDEEQCTSLRQLTFEPCGCTPLITPSSSPTTTPTTSPNPTTDFPTKSPSLSPTRRTTRSPTQDPTSYPSPGPTPGPTTSRPTSSQSNSFTSQPSIVQSYSPTSEPSTSLPSVSPTTSIQPTCNICGDGNEVTIWNGYIFQDSDLTCLNLFLMSEKEGMEEEFCMQLQFRTTEACGCTPAVPSATPTTTRVPTDSPSTSTSPASPPSYWESYTATTESPTSMSGASTTTTSIFLSKRSFSFEFLSTTTTTMLVVSLMTMII